MGDRGYLAMHDPARADDLPAKRRADGLMSQTYPQHRPFPGKMPYHINADAGILRRTRSRRNNDMAGLHGFDFFHRDLVVATHFHRLPQLAEILDQVVSERVVIIENENHELLPSKKIISESSPAEQPPCWLSGLAAPDILSWLIPYRLDQHTTTQD